jgi:hypothetical protein
MDQQSEFNLVDPRLRGDDTRFIEVLKCPNFYGPTHPLNLALIIG